MNKTDKSWIDGFFEGYESGEDDTLTRVIENLRRQRARKRKAKLVAKEQSQ